MCAQRLSQKIEDQYHFRRVGRRFFVALKDHSKLVMLFFVGEPSYERAAVLLVEARRLPSVSIILTHTLRFAAAHYPLRDRDAASRGWCGRARVW